MFFIILLNCAFGDPFYDFADSNDPGLIKQGEAISHVNNALVAKLLICDSEETQLNLAAFYIRLGFPGCDDSTGLDIPFLGSSGERFLESCEQGSEHIRRTNLNSCLQIIAALPCGEDDPDQSSSSSFTSALGSTFSIAGLSCGRLLDRTSNIF